MTDIFVSISLIVLAAFIVYVMVSKYEDVSERFDGSKRVPYDELLDEHKKYEDEMRKLIRSHEKFHGEFKIYEVEDVKGDYNRLILKDCTIKCLPLRWLSYIHDCKFENVRFEFYDHEFGEGFSSSMKISDSTFNDCVFVGNGCLSGDIVSIDNCVMNNCEFKNVKMNECTISNSDMRTCDLTVYHDDDAYISDYHDRCFSMDGSFLYTINVVDSVMSNNATETIKNSNMTEDLRYKKQLESMKKTEEKRAVNDAIDNHRHIISKGLISGMNDRELLEFSAKASALNAIISKDNREHLSNLNETAQDIERKTGQRVDYC